MTPAMELHSFQQRMNLPSVYRVFNRGGDVTAAAPLSKFLVFNCLHDCKKRLIIFFDLFLSFWFHIKFSLILWYKIYYLKPKSFHTTFILWPLLGCKYKCFISVAEVGITTAFVVLPNEDNFKYCFGNRKAIHFFVFFAWYRNFKANALRYFSLL